MKNEEKRQAINRAWWKVHKPMVEELVRKMDLKPTKFVGYDTLECETHLTAILRLKP